MGAKRDKRVDLFTPHAYSLPFRGNARPWPLLSQLLQPGVCVCVYVRAHLCVRGFVKGSALNPAHRLFSHGNKWGGPSNILPHTVWWTVQGVCRQFNTNKSFLSLLFYDHVHNNAEKISKNKCIFFTHTHCQQFPPGKTVFPRRFLKGFGTKDNSIISIINNNIQIWHRSYGSTMKITLPSYNYYHSYYYYSQS